MPEPTEWTTELIFEDDPTFDLEFEDAETFDTTMDRIVEVMTSDHRELTHRDAAEQHPIESITHLEPELAVRPSAALNNQDIQNILNF